MLLSTSVFSQSWSAIQALDAMGIAVILAILGILVISLVMQSWVRVGYANISREVRRQKSPEAVFRSRFLQRIMTDVRATLSEADDEINTVALIEHRVNTELGHLLLGERFVRAATGLVIVLGLAGTFYGLTLSIGKLVALVSSDGSIASADSAATSAMDISQSLTAGLTQALGGMSVAFTTSFAGILAAVVLTLVGIFSNVAERRTAMITQVEVFLDRVVSLHLESIRQQRGDDKLPITATAARLERAMETFQGGLGQLERSVAHLEGTLAAFSNSTRDFGEFNVHLRDNIARMSLAFSDMARAIDTKNKTMPFGSDRTPGR